MHRQKIGSTQKRLQNKIAEKKGVAATAVARSTTITTYLPPAITSTSTTIHHLSTAAPPTTTAITPYLPEDIKNQNNPSKEEVNYLRDLLEYEFKRNQFEHKIMEKALQDQNYPLEPIAEYLSHQQLRQLLICLNELQLKICEISFLMKDSTEFTEIDESGEYSTEEICSFFSGAPAEYLLCQLAGGYIKNYLLIRLSANEEINNKKYIKDSLIDFFPKLILKKNQRKLNELIEKIHKCLNEIDGHIKVSLQAVNIYQENFEIFGKMINFEKFFSDIYNDCFKNPYFNQLPLPRQELFRINYSNFCHKRQEHILQSPSASHQKNTINMTHLIGDIVYPKNKKRSNEDLIASVMNLSKVIFHLKNKGYNKPAKASAALADTVEENPPLDLLCIDGDLEKIKAAVSQLKISHKKTKILGDEYIVILALFRACENGHSIIVKYLLEQIKFTKKINYRLRCTEGKSSLDIAVEKKQTLIIAQLLEHPAINPRGTLLRTTDPEIRKQLEAKLPLAIDYPLAPSPAIMTPAVDQTTTTVAVEDQSLAAFEDEYQIIETRLEDFREKIAKMSNDIAHLRMALQNDRDKLGKAGTHEVQLSQIKVRLNKVYTDLQNGKAKNHLSKKMSEDLNIISNLLEKLDNEIIENLEKHPYSPEPFTRTALLSSETKESISSTSALMSAHSFWHSQGHTLTHIDRIANTLPEQENMQPIKRTLGLFLPKASPIERIEHDANLLRQFTDYKPDATSLIEQAMQMDAILDFITTRMEDQKHYIGLVGFDDANHVRNGLVHSHDLCAGIRELEFFDSQEFKQVEFNTLYAKIIILGKKIADYFDNPENMALKATVESDVFYAEIVTHGKKHTEHFSRINGNFFALKVFNKRVQYETYMYTNKPPLSLNMYDSFMNRVDVRGSIYEKSSMNHFPETRPTRHAPTVVLPPPSSAAAPSGIGR